MVGSGSVCLTHYRVVGRRLRGELRQPRVADEGDRAPEPVALFLGEVGEKGEEVELVAAAGSAGLVEEQDFGNHCGHAPRGLPDSVVQWQADTWLAAHDPVVSGAFVDLHIEAEAL